MSVNYERVAQVVDGKNGMLFPVEDDMKLNETVISVLNDEFKDVIALNVQSKAQNMFDMNVSFNFGELLRAFWS